MRMVEITHSCPRPSHVHIYRLGVECEPVRLFEALFLAVTVFVKQIFFALWRMQHTVVSHASVFFWC